MILEARALRRGFRDRVVIDDVSLAVAAGDSIAIVGPSGCGKTTLLQMLGLLDPPDGGAVLVDGGDAWSAPASQRSWLRCTFFGFVFQQNNLLESLSTRDNVALPSWRATGSRQRARRAADEWLERFGLRDRASARVNELSVGEAQRAAVARALVNRPRMVLADEPTGSLDAAAAAVVLDSFAKIREAGAALIVVTHDAAVAARCERRLGMQDGGLVA